jgi:UDP-N-acetylglucosamine 4,6-dehydratase
LSVYAILGGTGSLGTALTHQLLSAGHKVRVVARNEHSHEKLERQIEAKHQANFSGLLGAVEDRPRLRRALRGVEYVIHAAAQKSISSCEYNPIQAIQTNVIGSRNVIDACIDAGVKRAVLVSTDKASSPSTLYGASKLCAERLFSAANRYSAGVGTEFVIARYGNVFASQGSVIHAFKEQAAEGQLKVTDKQCTRFHMLLREAVAFVLRVLGQADPGCLWVPRLHSYRLVDLAAAFSSVYGLAKPPAIVGKRPAEKIHESMVSEDESACCVSEDAEKFVLEPGKVHQDGGWRFTSDSKQSRKLSVEELEKAIREWMNGQ